MFALVCVFDTFGRLRIYAFHTFLTLLNTFDVRRRQKTGKSVREGLRSASRSLSKSENVKQLQMSESPKSVKKRLTKVRELVKDVKLGKLAKTSESV